MMIGKNVSFEPQISPKDVSKNNIQQQVLNLNSKKPGTFGNIPIRHWKVPLIFEMRPFKTYGVLKYQENSIFLII